MPDDLNFDRAQYTPDPTPASITPPEAPVPEYYRANSGANAAFPQALLYGVLAALACCIAYGIFTGATGFRIGYLGLAVGYAVGKAMIFASRGRGGRNYQIAAAVLTYLSIALAAIPAFLWERHAQGAPIWPMTFSDETSLFVYGIGSPFFALRNLVSGLIGLVILFIALRAAWRLTSADANTSHHPFSAS